MGGLKVTTVPLPCFWSSSKIEGNDLERQTRRTHLCRNPRCAANAATCGKFNKGILEMGVESSSKNSGQNYGYGNSVPSETTGFKKYNNSGRCADCNPPPPPSKTVKPLRELCTDSTKGSTEVSSKGSISPVSSTSCPPSISTPTRISAKPSSISHMHAALSTGIEDSSSSTFNPQLEVSRERTQCTATLSSPICPPLSKPKSTYEDEDHRLQTQKAATIPIRSPLRLSKSKDPNDCDGHLAVSSPQGGGVTPPNSESNEDIEAPVGEARQHCSRYIMPLFYGSESDAVPQGSDVGLWTRKASKASDSNSITFKRPPSVSDIRTTASILPPQSRRKDSRTASMPSPRPSSGYLKAFEDSEDQYTFGPRVEYTKSKSRPENERGDRFKRSYKMAVVDSVAQMSMLEHSFDCEDHKVGLSKLATACGPKISSPAELRTLSEKGPTSAFDKAPYNSKAILKGKDMDTPRHRCAKGRKLRVVMEVAALSVVVTLLVAIFYPLFMRGLTSHLYGCCSCSIGPGPNSAGQEPSYTQARPPEGWTFREVRSLVNCPMHEQAVGSTVRK